MDVSLPAFSSLVKRHGIRPDRKNTGQRGLGPDPGLELGQLPLHGIREGPGTASDLAQVVLALRADLLPEVAAFRRSFDGVRDHPGKAASLI